MFCQLHSRPQMCALCVGVCLLIHTHIHSCHGDVSTTVAPQPDAHTALASKAYLKEIFAKYGNGEVLSFDGFERLLHGLGLGHADNHGAHKHHDSGVVSARSCNISKHATSQDHQPHKRAMDHSHVTVPHKCLPAEGLLAVYRMNNSEVIQPEQFLQLCPALIQQLYSDACHPTGQDHDHGTDQAGHAEDVFKHLSSISGKVWGLSFLSVTIISLVGLLCVAIVPLTRKVYFNHVIQYLVAVAVGSLTGDALLHLLPHSMVNNHGPGHKHGHDKSAVWAGLVGFAGIYIFFLTERLIALFAEWRRNRRAKILQEKRFPIDGASADAYPPMMNELGTKLTTNHSTTCDDTLTVVHPSRDVKKMADEAHDELHSECDVAVRDTWGHTHAGGHTHGMINPASVSSVALMVIMGDGLHNFCDGLAIGAAFCHSLPGGLSTSVAILCHELPHELGDFAVLLRVGMSVRQALIYNCLSSVLCLLGMLVGLAVGNIESASSWIFALAAGMFLYIALVDMVPEMTSISPKAGETPFLHFGLQNIGILTGASIMLVIALYEDEINI